MTIREGKLTKVVLLIGILLVVVFSVSAQQQYGLDGDWKCKRANSLKEQGEQISKVNYSLKGWMPAVVPGTVLTSLLHNKLIPDPFYGMNNKRIPDIYNMGRDYYTYWFVRDFNEVFPAKGDKVWLMFRGINYSCKIYINGRKLNDKPDKGMFLRQSYDITSFLSKDGYNRLAVIVYPPDPVGNPNGGQGGDGVIAHSVTNQYVAGWDWIQPIHDRNTGIWDKVFIRKTKQVHVENTHVVTLVPGKRNTDGKQAPATIKVTTEVENPDTGEIEGVVQFELEGKKMSVKVKLAPQTMELVEFPPLTLDSPRLWWPNGYGPQNLYNLKVKFLINGTTVSDEEPVQFGVRELKAVWNTKTNSREIRVNGQKIFIKGGNWILSDAMLRFSKERYDAEIRFHRDMNLNLIRVWGGGITERPEFYDACDRYGLLVMQDFWVSGDCNGRWYDPLKLEDTLARRKYPDDHALFLESLEDQIKMLRNHPSLAIWCGGNEIRPPADVLVPLRDSLLPALDGTRFFFEYSNDDSMSLHSGDGPYTLQPDKSFWEKRSFPFNSEVGSVGIGDYESLQRFIPKADLVPPYFNPSTGKWVVDSVWQYHKYSCYDSAVEAYGHPEDIEDFATKAQLVNYNQYRALMEGFTAHMWDWYTGVIIWKTQNPWTAMVGQMYDVYLDPNASLYGLSEGAKPLHIMYDPIHKSAIVANNKFNSARIICWAGICRSSDYFLTKSETKWVSAQSCVAVHVFGSSAHLNKEDENAGVFLVLHLVDSITGYFDENIYALPDSSGSYSWLNRIEQADIIASAYYNNDSVITVTIKNNDSNPLAFFNRISLVDKKTKKRILPVFYNNNYISVPPGEVKTVRVSFSKQQGVEPMVCVEGWNVDEIYLEIKK